MKAKEIKKAVKAAREKIAESARLLEVGQLELKQVRKQCPHKDKESWTNNDGYGQFVVERCNTCGDQRDGGLGR